MSLVPRKNVLALTLLATGFVLAMVGVGASLGLRAPESTPVPAAQQDAKQAVSPGGIVADATLDLKVATLHEAPTLHLDPAQAHGVALPGASADRRVNLPSTGLPVGLDASLALGTGREASREAAPAGAVATSSVAESPVLLQGATAALAAAAFAGAGLLAYFGAGIKKVLWLPVVTLYAKVSRAEVFQNEVRERIFQAIRANPGASASDLAHAAGVAWGTTIYHLDVLEQTRMVTSLREGRHRRYFENGAQLAATKETVAILCNPVTAQVAQRVKATPGLTQKDLAQATGLTPQALHWHLVRLVRSGVVRKQREGRVVRHFSG